MENIWGEIRTHYATDTEVSIDAWLTPDDDEEGKVIATIDLSTDEIIYVDQRAKTDSYAQEIIREVLAENS